MKELVIPILLVMIFAACRKGQMDGPPPPHNSIVGKWNNITITVVPLDSTGSAINNGTIYIEPPYFYFQFKANNTWVENWLLIPVQVSVKAAAMCSWGYKFHPHQCKCSG
jgi:hypothetical protein